VVFILGSLSSSEAGKCGFNVKSLLNFIYLDGLPVFDFLIVVVVVVLVAFVVAFIMKIY
jgi:hypothetical protein